jgi:hypothetical protein
MIGNSEVEERHRLKRREFREHHTPEFECITIRILALVVDVALLPQAETLLRMEIRTQSR